MADERSARLDAIRAFAGADNTLIGNRIQATEEDGSYMFDVLKDIVALLDADADGAAAKRVTDAQIGHLYHAIVALKEQQNTANFNATLKYAEEVLKALQRTIPKEVTDCEAVYAKLLTQINNLRKSVRIINPMFRLHDQQAAFERDIQQVLDIVNRRLTRLRSGFAVVRRNTARWTDDASKIAKLAASMMTMLERPRQIKWDTTHTMLDIVNNRTTAAAVATKDGGGGGGGGAKKSEDLSYLETKKKTLIAELADRFDGAECPDMDEVMHRDFGKISAKLPKDSADLLRARKIRMLEHARVCNHLEETNKQIQLLQLANERADLLEPDEDADTYKLDETIERLQIEVSQHSEKTDQITKKISWMNGAQGAAAKSNARKTAHRQKSRCGAGIGTHPPTGSFVKTQPKFDDPVIPRAGAGYLRATAITEAAASHYATSVVSMLKAACPSHTYAGQTSLNWVALNSVHKALSLATEADVVKNEHGHAAVIERIGADKWVRKIQNIIVLIIRNAHEKLKPEIADNFNDSLYDTCSRADVQIRRNIYLMDVAIESGKFMEASTMNALLAQIDGDHLAGHRSAVNICFGLWILARTMSPLWDATEFEDSLSDLLGAAQPPELDVFNRVLEKWANKATMAPVHRRALCAALKVSSSVLKSVFVDGDDDAAADIHAWPEGMDQHQWIANIIKSREFVGAHTPMDVTPMGILTVPPFQETEAYETFMIDIHTYNTFMAKAAGGQPAREAPVREFAMRLTFWLLLNTQFHRLSLERRIHLCLALCIAVPPPHILNSRMDVPFVYRPFVDLLHTHRQRPCAIECVRLINWFWGNALVTARIHEMVVEHLCGKKTVLTPAQCMRWALTTPLDVNNMVPNIQSVVTSPNANHECANYVCAFQDAATILPVAMRYHTILTAMLVDKDLYVDWIRSMQHTNIYTPSAPAAHKMLTSKVVPHVAIDVLHENRLITMPVLDIWQQAKPEYVVAGASLSAMMARDIDAIVQMIPLGWDMAHSNTDASMYAMQTSGRLVSAHILSTDAIAQQPYTPSLANAIMNRLLGKQCGDQMLGATSLGTSSRCALYTVVAAALLARSDNEAPYVALFDTLFQSVGNFATFITINKESNTIEFPGEFVDEAMAAFLTSTLRIQDGWPAFGDITKLSAVFSTTAGNYGCMCVHNKEGATRVVNANFGEQSAPPWSKSCVRDHLLCMMLQRLVVD